MAEEKKSNSVQVTVALITLIGVLATAVIANLDKIGTFFNSQSTPAPAPAPTPAPAPNGALAGSYTFETDRSRLIRIEALGQDTYRIEEPNGSWPWKGTAEVQDTRLTGLAEFTRSKATMKLRGRIAGDGSIVIAYHFITKGDGAPADNRVDRHVWVRR